VWLREVVDPVLDAAIAEQIGDAYAEANQLEFGDRADDDLEALERPVPTDVAQAWIKDSRENCNPVFRKELVTDIKQWYAEEVRPMNRTYASNGDGEDMPVPATARVVMWVIRFATAFARVHQREEVAPDDIDRAESLARRLVGQNWDGEKFDPNVVEGNTSPSTQDERKERLKDALERADDPLTPAEIAERTPLSEDNVNDELEVLSRKGEVYQPQTGEYLPT
jgi:DNA replicative helicase MCM subunit Mcm2 (Cdc46/Mcm family)